MVLPVNQLRIASIFQLSVLTARVRRQLFLFSNYEIVLQTAASHPRVIN